MLAFVAAALFTVAALLSGANVRVGPLTPSVLLAIGLACLAVHLAVGSAASGTRGVPVLRVRDRSR